MDILKKSLAPITDAAWDEINEEAVDIFESVLSARRFVDVSGPHGIDFGGVHTGRIDLSSQKNDSVSYGLNQVMPLVEARSSFSMNIWELDNAARGAEDIDTSAMEKAARDIADFEEKTIYYGMKKAGITGIKNEAEETVGAFPDNTDDLLNALSAQLTVFNRNGIEGPFSLVVNEDDWERLTSQLDGYPLRKQLKLLLKGSIILSPCVEEAFLISERGGDFRLTLGQDLSIGYHIHDKDTVDLYFTESFTFQCFEPAAVIVFDKSN